MKEGQWVQGFFRRSWPIPMLGLASLSHVMSEDPQTRMCSRAIPPKAISSSVQTFVKCPLWVRPWIQGNESSVLLKESPSGREIYLIWLATGTKADSNYRCLHVGSGKRHICNILLIKVAISAGCKVITWKQILSKWEGKQELYVLKTTMCKEHHVFPILFPS